jgi:signal transduction histidine kinase/ActR/RegA family two-component response regulator
MSPPSPADNEIDQRRLEVVVRQGAGLRAQIVLTSTIVAAIAWSEAHTAWLLGWVLAVVAVRELRTASLLRLLERADLPIRQRIRRTVAWNAVIGCANGSAALFMLNLDTTHDALLTMILVSWGAGGVATGATIVPAFLVYGAAMFVPTAAMWLLQGPWLGWGVATLVLMFFGVQIRYARSNCETFEESFRIRLENTALAQRLSEEHIELAAARDAAETANQAKSRFLASASHDLRQPLQALALNSGELARRAQGTAMAPITAEIGRSIDDLCAMLEGLLDISNLDAGSLQSRPRNVDLGTLVEGVAAGFRAAAAAKGLTLTWEAEPGLALKTDPDLLRRALANLTDNAIKFTSQGGVRLAVLRGNDAIQIRVIDSGIGIAPQDQRRVFDELVQLHNPERDRHKGYGLGLSIVRRLVTLLGGEIELQSQAGTGSTFVLRMACAPPEVAAPGTATETTGNAPPREGIAGLKLLVLDDDARVRGAYANALLGHGCEVSTAASIDAALAAQTQDPPDVAVVDFRLADGANGLQAIERLRDAQPGLVALLCTADTSAEIVAAAASGQVRMLRKPMDEHTLVREIAQAWRHRATQDTTT